MTNSDIFFIKTEIDKLKAKYGMSEFILFFTLGKNLYSVSCITGMPTVIQAIEKSIKQASIDLGKKPDIQTFLEDPN